MQAQDEGDLLAALQIAGIVEKEFAAGFGLDRVTLFDHQRPRAVRVATMQRRWRHASDAPEFQIAWRPGMCRKCGDCARQCPKTEFFGWHLLHPPYRSFVRNSLPI